MMGLLEEFLEFEKTEKLFELKYKGMPYWQAIRFDIYNKIFYMKASMQQVDMFSVKKRLVLYNRITTMLKNLPKDIRNYWKIEPGDLLYMDRLLERKVDDMVVDPYFDFFGFEEICSVRRCTINRYSGKYPSAEVGTSIPDIISAIGHIWNKVVYKIKWKYASDETKKIDEICEKINKKFGKVISGEQLLEKVLENVRYHKVYGEYYEKLINKVQPKAIITGFSDDALLYPLYVIAKKKHIPVIEMEHGLIINHISYNYGDTRIVGKELPDYMFSYGEFWSNCIKMPDCVKVITVGNPFLESRRNKFKDVRPDDKKIVFYSDSVSGKAIEKIILEFLNRNKEYKVYFKMHPMEMNTAWEKKYSLLVDHPDITMCMGDREIYELLATARHHVVVQSTVLYEALAFDTKRYIFQLNDIIITYTQPLIDSGLAYAFKNVEEFEQLLKNYPSSAGTLEINQLWKPNAKGEGQKTLRKIMYDN